MNDSVQRRRRMMRRAVTRARECTHAADAATEVGFTLPYTPMTRLSLRIRRLTVLATCGVLCGTAQASAQSTTKERFPAVLFAPQAQYGAPLRGAAGLALFIPTGAWTCDGWCSSRAVAVHGAVGSGGWRAGAGISSIGLFPADATVTVTRTASRPRGASAESTYVGVEAGFAFPFYEIGGAVMGIRPSVGYARRVGGAPTFAHRTTVTWSIGVTVMAPKFRDSPGG